LCGSSTITQVLYCEQDRHMHKICHHIVMDGNPTLIINCNYLVNKNEIKGEDNISSLITINTWLHKLLLISQLEQSLQCLEGLLGTFRKTNWDFVCPYFVMAYLEKVIRI
jgi:hypothetical protein